jgi:hypothetical protein
MSAFKTQRDLLGLSDDDDDDDEEQAEGEEQDDEAEGEGDDDDEDEDEDDEDEKDEKEGEAEKDSKGSAHKKPKSERAWLAQHFIKQSKTDKGIVYKSELLPGKTFFSREKMREFVAGNRYKRLLHEMKKGMRTHEDNEKLKHKADARRERQQARRVDKVHSKRKASLDADADADEIERRKASFQAKKARRLERKAAAAAGTA